MTEDMIQVKVHGDIWQAESIMRLEKDMGIRVVGIDGLVLLVEPVSD